MSADEARRAWARRYIAAAPVGVSYGSPEWVAMPDGPEKWGVAIIAAEARLSEAEDALERLRVEHLADALEAKRAADAEYVEQRQMWWREWTGNSWRPHPVNRRTGYAERVGSHRQESRA